MVPRSSLLSLFVAAMLMAAIGLSGCSPPAVSPDNLRLTASLRTAISARNSEWLEQNAEKIAERHAAGEMTASEHAAFERIVGLARDGEWEQAERDVVRLQKAQRPTAEQRARIPQPVRQ